MNRLKFRSCGRGAALMHILLAAVVAGLVAAGGAFFLSSRFAVKANKAKKNPVKKIRPTFIHDLGDFMVNLSDPGRYLKVSLSVEVESADSSTDERRAAKREDSGQSAGEGKLPSAIRSEFEAKLPIVRDSIIEQLSTASFHSLLTPQGRRALRASITAGLNSILHTCRVKRVYFTNFTMQ